MTTLDDLIAMLTDVRDRYPAAGAAFVEIGHHDDIVVTYDRGLVTVGSEWEDDEEDDDEPC